MEQPHTQGQPSAAPSQTAEQPQLLTRKQRRELRRQEKHDRREREARAKTTGRIVAWVIVIVVLAGASIGFVFLANRTATDTGSAKLASAVSSDDHTKGPAEAPVNLIEYSDFQCPACGSYFPIVQQLLSDNAESVLFAYRHFPLRSIHRNAQRAAEWAEAAAAQDKFFEFHDLLFQNQDAWSDEGNPTALFKEYGEQLGLDAARLESDAQSSAARDSVNRDYASGTAAGVNATPTFFLNGAKIQNPASLAKFQAVIDDAVSAAGGTPANANAPAAEAAPGGE